MDSETEQRIIALETKIAYMEDFVNQLQAVTVEHTKQIDALREENKLMALKKAQESIIGSFAFAIIFDSEPETIYVMRKNSPLIVAEKDNNFFVASDIAAILSHTNLYYLLDQGDIAKISNRILIVDKFAGTNLSILI